MQAYDLAPDRDDEPHEDQHVFLNNVTWADYESVLRMRGDRSAPRIAFLDGTLEIMSPSKNHESVKSMTGRLVETYCVENNIECSAYGSWTLKDKRVKRGSEPDECYVFGNSPNDATRPDLAIEIVWTHGGLDKLEIYRLLGVREVWYWRKGRFTIHVLVGDKYEPRLSSEVLPSIDLIELATFLDRPTLTAAVRDYRAHLAGKR